MKKRTKITLRTKIYLTIAGLVTLTGILYAANPTPFATVPGPVGVAAIPDSVLATEFCDQNLNSIDCNGNVSLVATIPAPTPAGTCIEKYMAIAPNQSVAAGFTPRDVFITQGADVYKFSGGIITLFATVACPLSDHSSLTFDHEGTFEFKMIMTCENGPVFKIDGTGNAQFIANTTDAQHQTHIEGPAVVPPAFGPLGGQILVADDMLGQVHAIKNDGTVTHNAFNWSPPDWDGAESVQVIPSNPCPNCSGGAFFQSVYTSNAIYKYPLTDLTGLGGNVLVNSENQHGTALVTFNGSNYVTTLFDSLAGNHEGASFVDCDVPTPTPTPTQCTGSFVIGDLDAVVGNHVTFWGAQWWKLNHLSGGRAPASFKGFANCSNPPCGGTWESDPGNSSHPPDTVPADMTVIVSSLITKSGPVESGDIPMMVTIHTDPGYQPNPGHAGTGTVTAVVCGSPHRPQHRQPARRPR